MEKESPKTLLEIVTSCDPLGRVRNDDLFVTEESLPNLRTLGTLEREFDGVIIGTVVGFEGSGEPLVDFPANVLGEYLPARSIVALGKNEIGREVTLSFEGGDYRKPIVMGIIQQLDEAHSDSQAIQRERTSLIEAEVDGDRLIFTAEKEIILRCGKASITLTRAGKIIIRGEYILSRSSGVNRIKGGSVQIN